MPLSSGVFLPCLVTGAAIGRFWGEFLQQHLDQVSSDINNVELFGWHIAPGGYALVGMSTTTLLLITWEILCFKVLLPLLGPLPKHFLVQLSYSKYAGN